MQDKNYFSAAQVYNQIILQDSFNLSYQYLYADASRLNFDNDISLHWYQKVFKTDNGKNYPETIFWIGELLKSKAQYKQAKKFFTKFASSNRRSKNEHTKLLVEKAKLESEACDLSQLMMKNPLAIVVEHLDSNINSKVSEYAPIEADSLLYFSSLRNKNDKDTKNDIAFNKIFISKKEQQKWKRAQEMDSLINQQGVHTANTCFNSNFTEIIFSQCQQKDASTFVCQLYQAQYLQGKWSKPTLLPSPINTEGSSSTQPALAQINNDTYLFFSSNRSGGQGGMDIWYAKKTADNSYSAPTNAGKLINSYEDEITPYFEDITQTLYFSSNHHKGMGGFDVFKSEYKNETFKAPENAGYPLNSPLNDIYYSINSKKDKAYLSSNRIGSFFEEKQSCCNDIYAFAITPLIQNEPAKPIDTSLQIISKMKLLVPLTLYFHNDEPDAKTKAITTKKNYKKTCEDYLAMKPLYLKEFSKNLKNEEKQGAENRIENFFEDSVQAGFNDLEKFSLLLEEVLNRGETVKITMQGFCSPLASTDYNINLAKRRISSLQNYFNQYKNALFVPYVQSGKLIYYEEHVGELPASKQSDDYYDTRNSIYNTGAAAERKIQIIAVSEIR
ncbi:MAG: hypothetical protein JST67_01445 [Bacteroidetes bacterium]|nr:hypothetical protein [Bacteroidota bacterium]